MKNKILAALVSLSLACILAVSCNRDRLIFISGENDSPYADILSLEGGTPVKIDSIYCLDTYLSRWLPGDRLIYWVSAGTGTWLGYSYAVLYNYKSHEVDSLIIRRQCSEDGNRFGLVENGEAFVVSSEGDSTDIYYTSGKGFEKKYSLKTSRGRCWLYTSVSPGGSHFIGGSSNKGLYDTVSNVYADLRQNELKTLPLFDTSLHNKFIWPIVFDSDSSFYLRGKGLCRNTIGGTMEIIDSSAEPVFLYTFGSRLISLANYTDGTYYQLVSYEPLEGHRKTLIDRGAIMEGISFDPERDELYYSKFVDPLADSCKILAYSFKNGSIRVVLESDRAIIYPNYVGR